MHQIRFRLGLRPRPRWGAYSTPPDPLAGFGGCFAAGEWLGWGRGGEGKRKEGEGEGREREGLKSLLNQGPSEPCYATGPGSCSIHHLERAEAYCVGPTTGCTAWDKMSFYIILLKAEWLVNQQEECPCDIFGKHSYITITPEWVVDR